MTARALRLALAASVFVSLFALGTIAGGLVALKRDDPRNTPVLPRPPGRPICSATQDLPPAEQARFQEAMRQVLASSRDLARGARQPTGSGGPVHAAAVRRTASALLDRARQADFALRSRLQTAAVDFAATLPVDERAMLPIGLERRGPLRGARP